ncbi:MAG: translation elongation factor EF-1 subunit alpha [Zestosphaera tikiterensis]|uniref:Elongation factor 1-alpha n=1 Tax=Zestosphaera tikiterensis TaxID=1973259 RepID=A0A2R7Y5I3_9CREN|nr:MAG: translation elongation factor EF-1 subunit alpha [Zestosphaera tikiterensis]
MSRPKKEHLNLVVIGHVDHGKSTLVGHTLLKLGALDPKMVKEVEEAAKKAGKESEKYAWFLDRLKEERERGLTIALSFMKFETPKYYWTIIDAPGHRDFVKNMITGASQADVALIVVSAKSGEFEAGMSREGQTMEHIVLAKTMGIDQVVVAITKMDITDPPYSKDRYLKIVDTLKKFMRGLGYKVDNIPFVPVSGWLGENLVERSPNMPWYNGPTLVEALDSVQPPPKPVEKPLRIPIQEVYSITGVGTVPVGRVETGRLRVGDTVVFMPPGVSGEVKSIEMHHEKLDEALPGDNIGFNVRGVSKTDIKRGDVAGHPQNPPTVVEEFTARVYVVFHPTAIHVGYTPVLHAHTASVAAKITEIIGKLDPKTGQIAEKNPQFIKAGESAIMKFKPIKSMVLEKFSDLPQLGRFAMRDMGKTIGIGVVMDVVPAKAEKK